MAVKESVTTADTEVLQPIAITAAQDTGDPAAAVSSFYVEVIFEQEATSHSLGARDAAAAIALLTARLLGSCSAGAFDAILSKVGEQRQVPILRQTRFHDVLLTDSRVAEVPRSAAPTATGPPSGDSTGGGLPLSVPMMVVMALLVVAVGVLWLVCRCFKKSNEVSPQETRRRMVVSNTQVLPS